MCNEVPCCAVYRYVCIETYCLTFLWLTSSNIPSPSGGEDFEDGVISVSFEALHTVVRFTVPIYNDDLVECPERFCLDLDIPSTAVNLGVIKRATQDRATVTITDANDGECYSSTLCPTN